MFSPGSELYTENVLSFTNPLSPRHWGSPAWDTKCEPGMNSPGISCTMFVLQGHWFPVREHRVMHSSLLKCHWSWLPEQGFQGLSKARLLMLLMDVVCFNKITAMQVNESCIGCFGL